MVGQANSKPRPPFRLWPRASQLEKDPWIIKYKKIRSKKLWINRNPIQSQLNELLILKSKNKGF